jgi:hypothetical protein
LPKPHTHTKLVAALLKGGERRGKNKKGKNRVLRRKREKASYPRAIS